MRFKLQLVKPLPPRQIFYAVPEALLSSLGPERTTVRALCDQIASDLQLPPPAAGGDLFLTLQGFELLPDQPFISLIQQNELLSLSVRPSHTPVKNPKQMFSGVSVPADVFSTPASTRTESLTKTMSSPITRRDHFTTPGNATTTDETRFEFRGVSESSTHEHPLVKQAISLETRPSSKPVACSDNTPLRHTLKKHEGAKDIQEEKETRTMSQIRCSECRRYGHPRKECLLKRGKKSRRANVDPSPCATHAPPLPSSPSSKDQTVDVGSCRDQDAALDSCNESVTPREETQKIQEGMHDKSSCTRMNAVYENRKRGRDCIKTQVASLRTQRVKRKMETSNKDKRQMSSCTTLTGPPTKGQRLKFEMLQLSALYEPEIKQFTGRVLDYDEHHQMVEFEMVATTEASRQFDEEGNPILRKFEMPEDVLTENDAAENSSRRLLKVAWGEIRCPVVIG